MWTFIAIASAQELPTEALDEARALLAAEDPAGAAAILDPWVERYPQDYSLVLELAWARFLAEDYESALLHYQAAAALSEGAWAARLGEAWCLVRLGDPGAREAVRALSTEQPGHADLRDLQTALPDTRWRSQVELGGTLLAPEQGPDAAFGVRGRIAAPARTVTGDFTLGLISYVGTGTPGVGENEQSARFGAPGNGRNGNSNGNRNGPGSPPWSTPQGPWDPDEAEGFSVSGDAWLRLSWTHEQWSVTGVGGTLFETTGEAPGGVLGGRVAWRGPVTAAAEVSWTRPPASGLDLLRIHPSVWLDLNGFALRPGGAVQLGNGSLLPSGELAGFVIRETWAVWLGGRVGTEVHSTELLLPSTVRWPDPVDGMAFAGLRVGRRASTSLSLSGSAHVLSSGALVPSATLTLDTPL